MKFGSLFSGVGGFDLGFERAGMECVWQVEFDKNCQNVLKKHWSETELFDDVRTVGKHNLKPVDVICGGFPCQDVSIAGKRAGLAGERSGLWSEFARIIDELEPKWVVIENVPGLLSSNNGKDIQIIIDSLTQMGYTVDIDIKDSQEFGVAQRRRRIFIICVKLDGLLQKKTILSRQISADLLAQILLNIWCATRQASSLVLPRSVCEKPIEQYVNLLRKMTSLLEITLEKLACKKYRNKLDVLLDQFGEEEKNSEFGLIRKLETLTGDTSKKTVMFPSELKAENGDMNISSWLNKHLDAVCKTGKQYITSTSINQITDRQIYIFAVTALITIERILLSIDWSVSCWSVVSSLSILLQENMNYARQASNNLFIESGLRDGWGNYLNTAPHIQEKLERHLRAICEQEILFESDGLRWDTEKDRKTGKTVAGTFTVRTGKEGGGKGYLGLDDGAMTLGGQPQWVMSSGQANAEITCERSPALTGLHEQPIVLGFDLAQITSKLNYSNPKQGDPQPPLNTLGQGFVAYENHPADSRITETGDISQQLTEFNEVWQFHGQDSSIRLQNKTSPSVMAAWGMGGNNMPFFGVRRLTPTECERLQGFPDGWTDGQADSHRYKQMGNAVTVNVAEWIGKKIMRGEK